MRRGDRIEGGPASHTPQALTLHHKVCVLFQQPSIVKRDDREGAVDQARGKALFAKIRTSLEDCSNE